jgi:hypothetical protein
MFFKMLYNFVPLFHKRTSKSLEARIGGGKWLLASGMEMVVQEALEVRMHVKSSLAGRHEAAKACSQRWSLLLPRIHYTSCSSAIAEWLCFLRFRAQLWNQRSLTPLQISPVGIRTPGVRIILRRYVSCNAALTESHT